MEIADGIHRIQTPLGDRVNCVYLLVGYRVGAAVRLEGRPVNCVALVTGAPLREGAAA